MKFVLPFAAATAALAACGGPTPAENSAAQLEEAAEYSTPEAADVLENRAQEIREQNVADPAAAHRALEAAGNAQAPPPEQGQRQE